MIAYFVRLRINRKQLKNELWQTKKKIQQKNFFVKQVLCGVRCIASWSHQI